METRFKMKIGVLLLLIALLPAIQFSINERREKIIPTKNVYLAVTPGEFAGTLMLGGFRGIAVDLVWLRIHKLMSEKNYFELVTLSDMVTKLQPHDRMVWEFNAWNRAYNVSIEFHEREDRWKWVKSGIDLNMKGTERLPQNWKVHAHLAFIFMHKCEGYQAETLRDYGEDNFALARKYYQKALKLNPDAPLYVDRQVIHTYEEQGDFENARRLYDEHIKKYPYDTTAQQNRDRFMREKELWHQFVQEAISESKAGNYKRTVEIYEDNIYNSPYLLPQPAIDAILLAYANTEFYDRGIEFIHARMSLRIDDKDAMYAAYDRYIVAYNKHYTGLFEQLRENGDNKGVLDLYTQKFSRKSVVISLQNGIIILDSMLSASEYKQAQSLFADLLALYPDSGEIVKYQKQMDSLKFDSK